MSIDIDLCTCFHDCRTCPQSGGFHQHSDDPCPEHPDVIDETGAEPLGETLQAWVDAEHTAAVDDAHRAEVAARR